MAGLGAAREHDAPAGTARRSTLHEILDDDGDARLLLRMIEAALDRLVPDLVRQHVESLRGEPGRDAPVPVLALDRAGHLWCTVGGEPLDLGCLRGPPGATGQPGPRGQHGRELVDVDLTDGGTLAVTLREPDGSAVRRELGNCRGARGQRGKAGVGVTGHRVDDDGCDVLMLTDGREVRLSRVGLCPAGEWRPGATYQRLDLVLHGNASWVATTDGELDSPSRTSLHWQLLAAGVGTPA